MVEKINSLYSEENEQLIKAEDIKIITNANIRLRDILKPYIYPIVIVTIAILVYFSIRYHKLGAIKAVVKSGVILILAQVVLLSILALIRFPMGSLTTPLVLIVYVNSLILISGKMEKEVKKVRDNK